MSDEDRAIANVWDRIPKALWKGLVEAAKTGYLARFTLTTLEELRDSCGDIPDRERGEMVRAIVRAETRDVERKLEELVKKYFEIRGS